MFHDQLSEAIGTAVVMTPNSIEALRTLTDEIKAQSSALRDAQPGQLRRPTTGYALARQPVSVHAVSLLVAEDSEVVVLGFRYVDPEATHRDESEGSRVPIKTSLASMVTLGIPVFLAWLDAIGAPSERGSDDQSS